jgi:hypothetical protein
MMSEGYCDVSLGDYDGDQATFYDEKVVTGRKPHKCNECRSDIPKGERHNVVTGKWDGEIKTYRFCAPCWEIMGEFSENGRTFGLTWETFRDEWAQGANLQGCLNRLTSVAAKQRMTEQWRKWKGIA